MIKKKLLIYGISFLLLLATAAGTVILLRALNPDPAPEDTSPSVSQESEALSAEKEAEALASSDPKAASDLYKKASKLYTEIGNVEKAGETAANAESLNRAVIDSQVETQEAPTPGSSAN